MKNLYKYGLLIVLLCSISVVMAQQQVSVSGRVTDGQGEPIVGATIREKGSGVSASTDKTGNYSITVDAEGTLSVSYVGYLSKELKVAGRRTLDITLESSEAALDEVVVVGYGTQKKSKLLGSVSTIDSKQLENRAVTNVSSALSGLAAGVQVKVGNGKPGSDGATIRVRGVGTMNNNDALVIIDGIQGVMDAVNPEDIESISILKDASSAAIYGARAANGVILITTKKVKVGQAPQIS